MMDKEDSWLYYREDVLENIDLNALLNNVEMCAMQAWSVVGNVRQRDTKVALDQRISHFT